MKDEKGTQLHRHSGLRATKFARLAAENHNHNADGFQLSRLLQKSEWKQISNLVIPGLTRNPSTISKDCGYGFQLSLE